MGKTQMATLKKVIVRIRKYKNIFKLNYLLWNQFL